MASDESRCITGHTVVADSGMLARRPRDAMKLWGTIRDNLEAVTEEPA